MNKTAKLSYKNCGTFWRIIITGDSEEAITRKYWSLFNWQAPDNDELNWETDFSGWVWCKPKKLLRALTNAHLFKLLNEADEKGENNKTKVDNLEMYGALGGALAKSAYLTAL